MKILKYNEGLVVKKYQDLKELLTKKFGAHNVIIYEDKVSGRLDIILSYGSDISESKFEPLYQYFKGTNWTLRGDQKRNTRFEIDNVPQTIREKLELELTAKKYNL